MDINIDVLNKKIFTLVNNKNFSELEELLKNNEDINLDIQDKNYNYLIDYLILYDQINLIKFILNNRKIRLDILTSDNKTILYNIIKFNKTEILNLLLEFDKTNIGVSIVNKKDITGKNCLFYCCIYNNFDMLKILFTEKDIHLVDNEQIGIHGVLTPSEIRNIQNSQKNNQDQQKKLDIGQIKATNLFSLFGLFSS